MCKKHLFCSVFIVWVLSASVSCTVCFVHNNYSLQLWHILEASQLSFYGVFFVQFWLNVTGCVFGHNKALNNLWLSPETVNALHLVYEVLVIFSINMAQFSLCKLPQVIIGMFAFLWNVLHLCILSQCLPFAGWSKSTQAGTLVFFFSGLEVHPKVFKNTCGDECANCLPTRSQSKPILAGRFVAKKVSKSSYHLHGVRNSIHHSVILDS